MKRKRHGKGPEEDAEKQHWQWEWLRRNKEYRKDFDRYKKALQKPRSAIKLEMGMKWGMTELPDPYNPPQEPPRLYNIVSDEDLREAAKRHQAYLDRQVVSPTEAEEKGQVIPLKQAQSE